MELNRHKTLLTQRWPNGLKFRVNRKDIRRILVICCENESPYSVTFGDLIIREPVIRLLSEQFPHASICVVLNREHFKNNILNNLSNVHYTAVKGEYIKKLRKKHLGKAEYNIFTVKDMEPFQPDILVDMSSRDGYRNTLNVLLALKRKGKIPFTIFANPQTKVFFAHSKKLSCAKSNTNRLMAHQIFLATVCDQLGIGKINVFSSKWFPKIEITEASRANVRKWLKKKRITPRDKAIFLIDKSLEPNKSFFIQQGRARINIFFCLAHFLHNAGFKIIFHRFYDGFEKKQKYLNDVPTFGIISTIHTKQLGALLAHRVIKGIIGIDTGVMHLASAVAPKTLQMTIFTNTQQDPICWCAPASLGLFFTHGRLRNTHDDISKVPHLQNAQNFKRIPTELFAYVKSKL